MDTGVRPQLLNELDEEDVQKYINDDSWCAQEKMDGRRRILIKGQKGTFGANRKGLEVPVDEKMKIELESIFPHVILDGEDMGDHVRVFDRIDLADKAYILRYEQLLLIMKDWFKTLIIVPTAWTSSEKQALYDKLKKDNAEGIVFKNINSMYTPGRPNSGGDQLKFKFTQSASVIAGSVTKGKRSVEMWVYDAIGVRVSVGNVTVYPNQEIPKRGAILEVKYLYLYPGGSLFQPVLLQERDDLHEDDCKYEKLKIKQSQEEEI